MFNHVYDMNRNHLYGMRFLKENPSYDSLKTESIMNFVKSKLDASSSYLSKGSLSGVPRPGSWLNLILLSRQACDDI